ncbi:MAG: MFS transporter [Pseudomonadota bacterium]
MENKKQLFTNLAAIYSSIFLSSIPFGMIAVLVAVKMDRFVGNANLISLSSAIQICAGIVFSKYLPRIAKKFGIIKTIQISTITAALMALLLYQYFGYFIWLLTIFIFGTALFAFSIIRQSITLDISPPHHKAIIVSLGGMLMSFGNALGPILLKFIGTETFLPHIIAAIFYLVSMLPMLLFKNANSIVREDKKIGIWRYMKISPKIMLGGFTFNYVQSSISTFLIIYGIRSGMAVGQASLLFSVLLFGTIFSIPMGYFTDLINRRFLILVSTILSLICAILLFFVHDAATMAILLFLLFGFMIGIKLPALILINEKYKPTQRLAVNSAFAKICLIGNLFGIFTTGAIMDLLGAKGLWVSVIAMLFLYLTISLLNYWHKFFNKSPLIGKIFLKSNINFQNQKI